MLAECHSRVKTIVAKEWWAVGWFWGADVECKLGYWEKLKPNVLLIVDNRPQILFHYGINLFYLSVRLGWKAVHSLCLIPGYSHMCLQNLLSICGPLFDTLVSDKLCNQNSSCMNIDPGYVPSVSSQQGTKCHIFNSLSTTTLIVL
jgi:hypothetical protein